jgi:hypothetical protein
MGRWRQRGDKTTYGDSQQLFMSAASSRARLVPTSTLARSPRHRAMNILGVLLERAEPLG